MESVEQVTGAASTLEAEVIIQAEPERTEANTDDECPPNPPIPR